MSGEKFPLGQVAPVPGARVLLLNVARRFIGSQYGMGYQLPLGLVAIGGPLADAGHIVKLVDADASGLGHAGVMSAIDRFDADIVMLSHTGSTAAYPDVESVCSLIKTERPHIKTVYGGVFPTFAYRAVMNRLPALDYMVRGEGERAATALANALAGRHLTDGTVSTLSSLKDMSGIDTLVWRNEAGETMTNPLGPPIENLDDYRFGWDLVDWDLYHLFGEGPCASIQFSRGCIYKCAYCGQWSFWRSYRHRSPENFVDNLVELRDKYGVKHVFPADEHFPAHRETTERLLDELIARDVGLPLYINTTVKEVLRDRDLMPRYRRAGIVFAALGVESDDPVVQQRINKNNSFAESREAVKVLRKNNMVALIQMIYGLEDETPATLWRKLRSIIKIDPDFANLEYITPHFWTSWGRKVRPQDIIQSDQRKWGYRNQIMRVEGLSETALFIAVKLSELVIHVRPKVLWRVVFMSGRYVRRFRFRGLWFAFRVWFMELVEFRRNTVFTRPGDVPRDAAFMELLLNKKADDFSPSVSTPVAAGAKTPTPAGRAARDCCPITGLRFSR